MSRYDALDHRTVLGRRHYRTHVYSDIDMGEVEGVTRSEANAPLTIQALIKARQGGAVYMKRRPMEPPWHIHDGSIGENRFLECQLFTDDPG